MRVAITGSHGLIGSALTQRLRREGHEVVRLVRRRAASPDERSYDPQAGGIEGGLGDVDAVVNLAGVGIANARWTPERKRALVDSRLQTTRTLVDHLHQGGRCRVFFSGSAIGYYGDAGERELDETSSVGEGFLAELVQRWEAEALRAESAVRVVVGRTGHVLSANGGLIGKQLPFYRLGLGGRIGNGQQWVSWISISDHISAVLWSLGHDLHGPVNLVAPRPVRNAELTSALGCALHRPTVLPLPLPIARVVFGRQMVSEAMLAGQRVVPDALLGSGFGFADTSVDGAFARIFPR